MDQAGNGGAPVGPDFSSPEFQHWKKTDCFILFNAVFGADVETVKKFLQKNKGLASCRMPGTPLSPLHYLMMAQLVPADRPKAVEIARLLIQNRADPNDALLDNMTPTLAACANDDNKAVLELLIAHGGNINAQEHSAKWNCAHVAVASGSTAILRTIIPYKAKLNEKDIRGSTPLHRAIRSPKSEDSIDLLLEAKADVDAPNRHQRTPLHLAAKTCNPGAAKALLRYNASVNVRDYKGLTPFQLSELSNCLSVRSMLFSQMRANSATAKATKSP